MGHSFFPSMSLMLKCLQYSRVQCYQSSKIVVNGVDNHWTSWELWEMKDNNIRSFVHVLLLYTSLTTGWVIFRLQFWWQSDYIKKGKVSKHFIEIYSLNIPFKYTCTLSIYNNIMRYISLLFPCYWWVRLNQKVLIDLPSVSLLDGENTQTLVLLPILYS